MDALGSRGGVYIFYLAALARQCGVSSEQIPDEQLRLFNEAEAATEATPEPEPIEVPQHQRRRGGRRPLPESLGDTAAPSC